MCQSFRCVDLTYAQFNHLHSCLHELLIPLHLNLLFLLEFPQSRQKPIQSSAKPSNFCINCIFVLNFISFICAHMKFKTQLLVLEVVVLKFKTHKVGILPLVCGKIQSTYCIVSKKITGEWSSKLICVDKSNSRVGKSWPLYSSSDF